MANTTEVTTTNTCHHHHENTHTVRTLFAPPVCYSLDNNYLVGCCNSSNIIYQPIVQNVKVESLLGEILTRCVEAEDHCDCGRGRGDGHSCEQNRQDLVYQLRDLLERSKSYDRGRWNSRCSLPHGHRHDRGGCPDCSRIHTHRDFKSETKSIFEVLFRITKRKTYRTSSRSRIRNDCRVVRRGDDADLLPVVWRLLDELEGCGGDIGWGCGECSEWFEVNLRRVRRALRDMEGEGDYDRETCGCTYADRGCPGSGYGGCVQKTIVYDRPERRPRSGNVHVGWSLR